MSLSEENVLKCNSGDARPGLQASPLNLTYSSSKPGYVVYKTVWKLAPA